MNHLRDLLDSLKVAVTAAAGNGLTDRQLDQEADWCASIGERAISFSMGDIASVTDLNVVPELVRLPYQTCWFECEIRPLRHSDVLMFGGMLLHTRDDGMYAGQVWSKLRGNWRFIGNVYGVPMTPGKWALTKGSEALMHTLWLQTKATLCFLSALNCCNVQRREHVPADKLQQARAKRGKAPLFSYWTLQLSKRHERGAPQGGTHSSPRVHLRRGHPRQFSPGRWTWVQPCVVGSKAAGIVHKDYDGSRLAGSDNNNHTAA